MSTDINFSRALISKIIQSARFLGALLSKIRGPLMKLAVPLEKNILAPLGITAAASAIDSEIQKKMHGSGCLSDSQTSQTKNFNNFKHTNVWHNKNYSSS